MPGAGAQDDPNDMEEKEVEEGFRIGTHGYSGFTSMYGQSNLVL